MQMGNTPSASEAQQPSTPFIGTHQADSTQDPSDTTSAAPASHPPPKAKKKPRTPKAAKLGIASPSPAMERTSSPGNVPSGSTPTGARKKQKKKQMQQNGAVDHNASPQTPINRFKAQHAGHSASPYSFSAPSQEYSPFPSSPSLVYFSGPSSAQFERVLNASFPKSINGLQSMVRSKLRVDTTAPIQMSFVNTDANLCPLDDEYDFEALVANASQAKRIKVQITTLDAGSISALPPPEHSAKVQPNAAAKGSGVQAVDDSTTAVATPPSKPKAPKTSKAPRQSKPAAVSAGSVTPATQAMTGDTGTPVVSGAPLGSDAPEPSQVVAPTKTPLRWEDRPTPASLIAALWPSTNENSQSDGQVSSPSKQPASGAEPSSKEDAAPKQTKKQSAKRKRQSDTQPDTQATLGAETPAASVPGLPASQPGGGKRPRVQGQPDEAALTVPSSTPAVSQETANFESTPSKTPRAKPAKKAVTDKPAPSQTKEPVSTEPVAEAVPASPPSSQAAAATDAASGVASQESTQQPSAASETINSTSVKRKPGRPRKSVPVEDAPAAPSTQEPTSSGTPLATISEVPPPKKAQKATTATKAGAAAPERTNVQPNDKLSTEDSAGKGATESAIKEAPEVRSTSSEAPAPDPAPSAATQTSDSTATANPATGSSQTPKPKARATKAKVDKCIVCKESPSHAKEDCQIFKKGPQAVHDLLKKYRELKSRKKEDRECVETLREWSNDLIRSNREESDAPLSQMSAVTEASTAPAPSQIESTITEPAALPVEKVAEPARKAKASTKKSDTTKDANSVSAPAKEAVELPPPSGVEASSSSKAKKTATPAKKKSQKTSVEEPQIAVFPSSPLGPDASQSAAVNTSPKRANGLRAPSESSEAELATSPLLSAVPRPDEDMDVDPLTSTPSSTPDAQLEERRRKLKDADAHKSGMDSASSSAAPIGKGNRSASVTSSDTSEDSDSSDDSETQSEEDSESEKTLNSDQPSAPKTADGEAMSKSTANGADRKSSSTSSSSPSSDSGSASSSSDDSDSSSSSEDESESSTPAAKKGNGAKSNGTPATSVTNPFLKGLTPHGNAKGSAAFSPKSTPFTRLSELKPSTLRQNMSQPSSPMSGGGLNGLGAQSQNSFFASKPVATQRAADSSDSDSDSGSSSASSSDEDEASAVKGKRKSKDEPKETQSSKRVIPASKRAGASSSPKKKKSVFSLFS